MKNLIRNETQIFGKNHSKLQKHYFGINQFLRKKDKKITNFDTTFGRHQNLKIVKVIASQKERRK